MQDSVWTILSFLGMPSFHTHELLVFLETVHFQPILRRKSDIPQMTQFYLPEN